MWALLEVCKFQPSTVLILIYDSPSLSLFLLDFDILATIHISTAQLMQI